MRCGAAVGCERLRDEAPVRAAAFQGTGAGRYLAEQAIVWAGGNGYRRVLLDTLPSMQRAQRLYESLGFRDADAYRPNPVPGVRYMSLEI